MMMNDLQFLDGPVDTTHDHYKVPDVMVSKLKEIYGYNNKIRESSQLYKRKKLTNTNMMNSNFLNEEMQKVEHDRILKDIIEKQLHEEIDIELDVLLNRGLFDKNAELMQKKIDFIQSLEEYNRIIKFQMVKELIEVKELQEKFLIDFNQKLQEIKDYASTIDDYTMMHVKMDDLAKKAGKSLTNYRKKELIAEKKKLDLIQEDYLKKIISNIDLILNSENVQSSPVKQLLLYKLNEMLFFLDEVMRKKSNYQTFIIHCSQTQNINLTNIDLFQNNDGSDFQVSDAEEEDENDPSNDKQYIQNINLNDVMKSQSTLQGNQIGYTFSQFDKKQPVILQQSPQNAQKKQSLTTNLEERIQQIQLRYQKYQSKKEKKKALSSPPIFSKEIIELELQNLVRFQNKLKLVEKILTSPQLTKFEEVKNYLEIVWLYQRILCIQISCANNKLEKYLIGLNNQTFDPQQIVRIINKEIKLLKSIPDQEQAKSYIENQKRNNTFKRYCNDQGKITNYHFVLNANNLKPLLQKLDPEVFLDGEKKQQKEMQTKLKIIKQKAEQKLMKSKLNHTTTQFITNTDLQSGRVSPQNSYKQSQESCNSRERCASQASAFSFLQKQNNQKQQQSSNEVKFNTTISNNDSKQTSFELTKNIKNKSTIINKSQNNNRKYTADQNSQNYEINQQNQQQQRSRNLTTGQLSRIKKIVTQETPMRRLIKDKININKYINDSFDSSGLNNNFCDKQKEIDISSNVHYVMLSNIFSTHNEVIEIEDFIEKEQAKNDESQQTTIDPKQLYSDRYSRFKLKSNQSTRPTTGKTINNKNQLNNSHIFEQSGQKQLSQDQSENKFNQKQNKQNHLSVSFYANDRDRSITPSSRPMSSYQNNSYKQKRSTSVFTSITPNQNTTQNNYMSIQQKQSGQNIHYQLKDISPIQEQKSKDLVTESIQSRQQLSENINLQTSQAKYSQNNENQQSLINTEGNNEDEQNDVLYLDDKEKKEAEKLKKRAKLMEEILERKRPRYIFLGNSRNPIKGTPEQIQEIERNAMIAQHRLKGQMQEQQKVKLQKRIQSLQKQWEVSNIEILAGPPRKYYVETSTIQHDFNDKVISKIINH